jgi:hypothetical protein
MPLILTTVTVWTRSPAGSRSEVRRVALLVAAAVFAGGCGGSEDNGSDGDERPTKAEWIAQADALCKESFAEAEAIPPPQSDAKFDEYLVQVLAVTRRFDPKFRALQAPEGDEDEIRNLVHLNEQGTQLFEELLNAVRAGDSAKIERIIEQGTANAAEFAAAANAYGSKECAKAGDTAGLR